MKSSNVASKVYQESKLTFFYLEELRDDIYEWLEETIWKYSKTEQFGITVLTLKEEQAAVEFKLRFM